MKLKRDSLIKAAQPTRIVKQLDRVVQSYKPVSDHKHNVINNISLLYFDQTCYVQISHLFLERI